VREDWADLRPLFSLHISRAQLFSVWNLRKKRKRESFSRWSRQFLAAVRESFTFWDRKKIRLRSFRARGLAPPCVLANTTPRERLDHAGRTGEIGAKHVGVVGLRVRTDGRGWWIKKHEWSGMRAGYRERPVSSLPWPRDGGSQLAYACRVISSPRSLVNTFNRYVRKSRAFIGNR